MSIHLKKIGATAAIGLVVGSIVGTGIFVTPAMVSKFTNNLSLIFLLWLVGGAMCAIGGEIYGRLGEKFPVGGGQYVYLEKSMGRRLALIYGWMCFLVISPSMIASYSMFFGEQAKNFAPSLSLGQTQALALAFLGVITLINYFGIQFTGNFEKIVVSCQILLILALAAGLSFFAEKATVVAAPTDPSTATAAAAIIGILWSYEGFNSLSFVAHEIHDSSKRLLRYVLIGCAVVMLLYFILNFLALHFLDQQVLQSAPNIAVPLASLAFGSWAGSLTMSMMIVAVFMSSVPAVMIGPRVTQAMADEGWLPRSLGRLHPKYTSPFLAILAQSLITAAFIFMGNFEWLISCFIVVSWFFYVLVAVGFLKLMKKDHGSLSFGLLARLSAFIALATVVICIQTYRDPILSLSGLALMIVSYFIAGGLIRRKRAA